MTTSARPISASDSSSAEVRAALAAGWKRHDIWWERLQEQANHDWEAGHRDRALRGFIRARWLALVLMSRNDPRQATSLANAAFAARVRGAERTAARRYARAIHLWAKVPSRLGTLDLAPRARSSLFHLRMELRHGPTFQSNQRIRHQHFVAEAGESLRALAEGRSPPVTLSARWKGAKPPVFDDARKLLAACLLIRS